MPAFRPAHLALYTSFFAFVGGVERDLYKLAKALAERGHRVDLVTRRQAGADPNQAPPTLDAAAPSSGPRWRGMPFVPGTDPAGLVPLLRPVVLPPRPNKALARLPDLISYLRREKPTALLAAKTDPNLTALWAKRLSGVSTRFVVSEWSHLSGDLLYKRRRKRRSRVVGPSPHLRRVYPWADAIVANSHGVADSLAECAGIPRERITTIYNPTVAPDLHAGAQAPLDHPWFRPDAPPVVLGVGRLVPQKDFPTLLRAFARVRARRSARLVILGEGKRRGELETLAARLGITADVAMPGFVEIPYPWMARAAVFALSSVREGLPNVLIEALACGCPSVSTDCPSGPAEILDGERYGRLVPVGDDAALARALCTTLEKAPPRERLIERGRFFSVDRAVERYERLLLGTNLAGQFGNPHSAAAP